MAFPRINSIADRGRLLSLVSDDDLREAIRHRCANLGLTVDTVCSGARAAKLLRKVEYRALVTDRVIPPWPGLYSLLKLKRHFPGLRVIVLLSRGPVGVASLLRLAGADEVIEGPMRGTTLISALAPLVAGSCPITDPDAVAPAGGNGHLMPINERGRAFPLIGAWTFNGEQPWPCPGTSRIPGRSCSRQT